MYALSSSGSQDHFRPNDRFKREGTWTIISGSGTGVFAGVSGSGTLTSHAGGDAYTIRYAGTVTIP